ncbi:terminase large subunit domain-containing protein [Neisseria sp. S1]|uniref:terminase large subunit domain-containing protein n=1 Tax=Neisseria sp. S1 TaxID=3318354 RepID=UPI003A861070
MSKLKFTKPTTPENNANLDPRLLARALYWQGWRISAIGNHLGIKPATVHSWKQRDNWDGGNPAQRVAASAEARLIQLINLPTKSDGHYKEIKQLSALVADFSGGSRTATSAPAANVGTAMPDPPTIDNPPQEKQEKRAKQEKKPQNWFEPEQLKRVQEIFYEQQFAYQRYWGEIGKKVRFRNILKSRQIGATFYFAREAFIDALISGRNQIFLSASRAQAFQFKIYISDLAAMVDVELKGDVITLPNSGAKLYFLGTNSRTAQGRTGNLYLDEYFWAPDFNRLSTLAKPMAAQKRFRITYFSTPSSEAHEAYPIWSGAKFNDGRPASEHISLDISHTALSGGRLDPDGQWRQIVTLDDAEAGGCTLFDKSQLQREYSPLEFSQLFNCEFMADGDAVFEFSQLKQAGVDSWDLWADFYKPFAPRPAGNLPVWIGYDPADSGDKAGLVAAIAPRKTGDKFRVIEHKLLSGNDFAAQAKIIKEMLSVYNVQEIVIDTTGIGEAVYQLVKNFFPRAIGIKYTAEIKAMMVNKALDLFRRRRIEWDAMRSKDMVVSFTGIRRQMTASGRAVTYVADRSAAASHCDLAWAAMMIFYIEPLDGGTGGKIDMDWD